MCLGLLSHCRGRRSKSSACCQHSSLLMAASLQSLSVHPNPRTLLVLTTIAAAFLNSSKCGSNAWYCSWSLSSDRDIRIPEHIQVCLRRLYYSFGKPDPCFSFESLALQDYTNKASDDRPATVATILGYRSMMVGNAIVAVVR